MKRTLQKTAAIFVLSCFFLGLLGTTGFAAESYTVVVGDAVNYSQTGNWTASTWIKANDSGDGVMSRMLQAAAGTGRAVFSLPAQATAGRYEIYYYLAHKTTGQTVTVDGNDIGYATSHYNLSGWSSDAQGAWVLLTTADLSAGSHVDIVTNGNYSRATSIRFDRVGNSLGAGVYLDRTFESAAQIADWTISASGSAVIADVPSAQNQSMRFTQTGSTQTNLTLPALEHTPVADTVVLDTRMMFDSMYTKTTFLVRGGSSNGLFMHAEFAKQADGIRFQYYDASTAATIAPGGAQFTFGRWYRLIAVFHCDTALYDVYIYDDNYLLMSVTGIHPKANTVTAGNAAVSKIEMQNHNTGASAGTQSVWYMDYIRLFDGSSFSLPDLPSPPPETVTYLRIGKGDNGFSLSDPADWTAATMPDSAGNAASYYGNAIGAYVQYTPQNLEAGWYRVSFWNIKYQNHQNPMKMTGTVFSNNETRTNIALPVNTTSEDRGGRWDEMGVYYFTGNGEEYVRLVSDGGSYARPADVKFELVSDYDPIPVLGSGSVNAKNVDGVWTAEARDGYYDVFVNMALEANTMLQTDGTLLDARYLASGSNQYFGTYALSDFQSVTVSGTGVTGVRFVPNTDDTFVTDYRLCDRLSGGAQITDLTAGELTASATVVKRAGETENVRLIAALYEDGWLRDVRYGTPQALSAGEEVTLSETLRVLQVTDQTRLFVYVWDADSYAPLSKVRGYEKSHGGDAPFLLTAASFESFGQMGTWTAANDSAAYNGKTIAGMTSAGSTQDARYPISVAQAGDYRIYVHSKNFTTLPNARHFQVKINGQTLSKTFGQVGEDGYLWEDGGVITLQQGENVISLSDSSMYYAKADAIYVCKTTDPAPPAAYVDVVQLATPQTYTDLFLQEADFMDDVTITRDFPGGNVLVEGMKKNVIDIAPDLSDTSTDWFYWNFKVTSGSDRDVTFRINGKYIISGAGAAYSYDDENWDYLPDSSNGNSFSFSLQAGRQVHFACAIPYQLADLQAYLATIENAPRVNVDVLCQSEGGRDVPIVTIGNPSAPKQIVFTSRHHCCEMTPSYVLEGLMDELIATNDNEFWNTYCVTVIPMVDIDGVENGDQGKQRIPHDHNRDYDKDLYAVTRAMKAHFADTDVDVFLDVHCPGLQDPKPYLYIYNDGEEAILQFSEILKTVTGANTASPKIVYDASRDFRDGNHYEANSSGYYYLHKNAVLSTTLEFPYTGTVQNSYTKDMMRNFGHQMAKAVKEYVDTYLQ